MDKPQIFTINNHVFESENPPGKHAHKGGNTQSRNSQKCHSSPTFTRAEENRVLQHTEFFGRQTWTHLQDILHPSLLLIYHSSKQHNTRSREKRSTPETIQLVNKNLVLSQNWSSSQKDIKNQPMMVHLHKRMEKESDDFEWRRLNAQNNSGRQET